MTVIKVGDVEYEALHVPSGDKAIIKVDGVQRLAVLTGDEWILSEDPVDPPIEEV